MHFEHHRQPLATREKFLHRLGRFALYALGFLTFSLCVGVVGYHWIAGLPWIDALLDACMILAGMGPVSVLTTNEAKLFASFYAVFSGVAFLTTFSILIAPVLHRVLHRLHLGDGVDRG